MQASHFHSTLIGAQALASHLDDPQCIVIDCRFDLNQPQAGEDAYRAAHIPAARYADLNRDLSSPVLPTTGRHPLPDPQQFAARLSQWGVMNDSQLIAYDADNGAFAARLWWLLRWVGHERVAVLDGGFAAWRAAGLPIESGTARYAPATRPFMARIRNDMHVDAAQVLAKRSDCSYAILDARAPERFAGTVEPLDTVAGHVPGAINFPFARNLQSNAAFRSATELRQQFEHALGNVRGEHVIAMCGSGVTACHNLLALEVAGLHGAKLYAGSWSEWIRDPSRPIARG